MNDEQVRRLCRREPLVLVPASEVLAKQPKGGRGRPPKFLLAADDVEAMRAEQLRRLGAIEPGEPPAKEVILRLGELEDENGALRGEVESLREALRLSVVIDRARLDQLQQVLAPAAPPPMRLDQVDRANVQQPGSSQAS